MKREVAKGTVLALFELDDEQSTTGRRVLLGRAAGPRPPRRERPAPAHLGRDLADRAAAWSGSRRGSATRAFKRTLAELEVGDEVEVEEPKGEFVLPEDTSPEYVFVAGGIGITVFRSMLRYIADEELAVPHHARATRTATASRRAFLDELEELERRIDGLRVVLTMTDEEGWEGETPSDRRGGAPRARRRARRQAASSSPARPRWPRRSSEALLAAGIPEEQILAGGFSGY